MLQFYIIENKISNKKSCFNYFFQFLYKGQINNASYLVNIILLIKPYPGSEFFLSYFNVPSEKKRENRLVSRR